MPSTSFYAVNGNPREQRESAVVSPVGAGATIWLTGLPSAGKSTIACALAETLRRDGHAVELLDGDEIRPFLSADLGFSRQDRDENVRRIGYVAELLARNGVKVLVAVVSPYNEARQAVRLRHDEQKTPFFEVHVAAPVAVCAHRDVKGLYAKQRSGHLAGLTGVDDPYEEPENPDLRVPTHTEDVETSARAVHSLLVERSLA